MGAPRRQRGYSGEGTEGPARGRGLGGLVCWAPAARFSRVGREFRLQTIVRLWIETPKRLDAEIRGRGAARRGSGATRPQPVTTASNGSALPPTTSSQEVYIPSRVRYKTSPDYQLLIELLRTSNARTSGAAAAANLGPVPPRIKTPSSASRQPPRRRSC